MNYQKDFPDPQGRLIGTFEQLMEAGCLQAEFPSLNLMFHALMIVTHENPCAGCPIWCRKGPECKAFQLYHTAYEPPQSVVKAPLSNVPAGHPLFGLSVKQIAKQLGISIGEVRRRKMNGTL